MVSIPSTGGEEKRKKKKEKQEKKNSKHQAQVGYAEEKGGKFQEIQVLAPEDNDKVVQEITVFLLVKTLSDWGGACTRELFPFSLECGATYKMVSVLLYATGR